MVISKQFILNTSIIVELLNMTSNTSEFKLKKQQLDEDGLTLFNIWKKKQYASTSYNKQKQKTTEHTIEVPKAETETIEELKETITNQQRAI